MHSFQVQISLCDVIVIIDTYAMLPKLRSLLKSLKYSNSSHYQTYRNGIKLCLLSLFSIRNHGYVKVKPSSYVGNQINPVSESIIFISNINDKQNRCISKSFIVIRRLLCNRAVSFSNKIYFPNGLSSTTFCLFLYYYICSWNLF